MNWARILIWKTIMTIQGIGCYGTFLNGLRYLDNNQTNPWVEENGNVSYTFSSYPIEFSFCIKVNLDYERYYTYVGLVYIEDIVTGNVLANIELSSTRDYNFFIEFPTRSGDFEWHFGGEMMKANFLTRTQSFLIGEVL